MGAVYGVDMPGSKVDKILRAMGQFGAEAGAVFMVGDSCSDMRAARQAGVNAIAVSWGHQSMGMLIRALPDLVVQFPEELIEAVQLTGRGL
jgi:phosphoglycolate phosphatase-like HAD superfamily hydrolase